MSEIVRRPAPDWKMKTGDGAVNLRLRAMLRQASGSTPGQSAPPPSDRDRPKRCGRPKVGTTRRGVGDRRSGPPEEVGASRGSRRRRLRGCVYGCCRCAFSRSNRVENQESFGLFQSFKHLPVAALCRADAGQLAISTEFPNGALDGAFRLAKMLGQFGDGSVRCLGEPASGSWSGPGLVGGKSSLSPVTAGKSYLQKSTRNRRH